MLGAQRRVEARIGELLGEPEKGGRGKPSAMPEGFDRQHLGADFRILARGFMVRKRLPTAGKCLRQGRPKAAESCVTASFVFARGAGLGLSSGALVYAVFRI